MLLPEIYNIIFELSDNKTLYLIEKTLQKISTFTNMINNILTKRRLCYPRIDGPKRYFVPLYCQYATNIIDTEKALHYLYYHGVDIVKGDIIMLQKSDQRAIYDGVSFHTYSSANHINILPKEFDIINDNVPTNYWVNDKHLDFPRCYVNLQAHKKQMLTNMSLSYITTNITLNNINYDIVFNSNIKHINIDIIQKIFDDKITNCTLMYFSIGAKKLINDDLLRY